MRQVESWENEMLCNKVRFDCTKEGDRNYKFYHAVIREPRKKQMIQFTSSNGDTTTSATEIGRTAVDFF